MVGYKNNQKGLHYYGCLKCTSVSVNAFTTQRAKRKGANDLFIDFLKQYRVPAEIAPLVKSQLVKLFDRYNAGQSQNDTALKTQQENAERKLKDLKVRFGLGEIDRETYELTFEHLNNQLSVIHSELNKLAPHISKLENLISNSLEKITNLSETWRYIGLEGKRRRHKGLFPDGVYDDVKNHEYLTKTTNSFLHLTKSLADEYTQMKNGTSQVKLEKSHSAPPAGLEPATL